jgi:hypothetical protein
VYKLKSNFEVIKKSISTHLIYWSQIHSSRTTDTTISNEQTIKTVIMNGLEGNSQLKYIPFIVTMMFNEKTNELITLNGFNVLSSHSPPAIK